MKQCKPKPCSECKQEFVPMNSLAKVCGYRCAIERVRRLNEQKATRTIKKQRKSDREALRARKQALKSKSDWLRECQVVFNQFIRERDYGKVCISCQKPPKKKNCGHYKSVGSSPELRFNELNCHLQCEHCNSYKSGNIAEYRINLVKKIGVRNIEWLEGPHQAQNLTIEDIKEIKQYYREQLKILKRGK